jgi:hypothetical protein
MNQNQKFVSVILKVVGELTSLADSLLVGQAAANPKVTFNHLVDKAKTDFDAVKPEED